MGKGEEPDGVLERNFHKFVLSLQAGVILSILGLAPFVRRWHGRQRGRRDRRLATFGR